MALRVVLAAVGRLRADAPEARLVADYVQRFDRTGRALGLGPLTVAEVEAKAPGGPLAEGVQLSRALPGDGVLVALDERGRTDTSPALARMLADWRDAGRGAAGFVIGGADGLDPALRDRADLVLSLGPMVWPHALARVMLAEQLYRATTILAGTPYHRA